MAKRRKVSQKKGIFCLEGNWFGTKDKTTVEPILRLLERTQGFKVPYLYRDVATCEEFDFLLKKWRGASFVEEYPILYLAFHGTSGAIRVGQSRKGLTLDELATKLEGACNGRIIHVGSCATLDVHGKRLNSFLRQTGALAVCGFRTDVDWLAATAFDVLLLGTLQDISFTRPGMRTLDRRLREEASGLYKRLDFRLRYL